MPTLKVFMPYQAGTHRQTPPCYFLGKNVAGLPAGRMIDSRLPGGHVERTMKEQVATLCQPP